MIFIILRENDYEIRSEECNNLYEIKPSGIPVSSFETIRHSNTSIHRLLSHLFLSLSLPTFPRTADRRRFVRRTFRFIAKFS